MWIDEQEPAKLWGLKARSLAGLRMVGTYASHHTHLRSRSQVLSVHGFLRSALRSSMNSYASGLC